ncbi:MAG: hypothetical protein IJN82_06165 [Clostridia bacterium]|nr:hypothetical protein [Clostridia bacterium]
MIKKTKFLFVLVFILIFLITSCRSSERELDLTKSDKEKYIVTSYDAVYTQEQLLEMSDLIVRGRVISKDGEAMSNPDNTRMKDGALIANALISSYTVKIDQIYKGNYEGETICVKTSYGSGLPPELILGEDEEVIVLNEEEKIDLSPKNDCILLLSYDETDSEVDTGYFLTMSLGYLVPDGNGNYSNNDAGSPVTVSPDTLSADLAALYNAEK